MNNLGGVVGYWTDTVPEDTGTIFASFDSASGSFNITGTSLTIYAGGKYGPHNDGTGMDTPYYSKNGGALTPFGNTYSTRTTIPIAAGDIITITATGGD